MSTVKATGIERTFIGSHFHNAGKEALKIDRSIGSLRLWDARLGWKDLEPQRNFWDFTALDQIVDVALESNIEILLPLGVTPQWAATDPYSVSAYGLGNASPPRLLADWENYVRKIVSRYRGRIAAYEIWNEPNRKLFFNGNQDILFKLTCSAGKIIREIDPSAKIVSSAPTDQSSGVDWLDAYLYYPIAKCIDVVGFHFYTLSHEPPETIIPLIKNVKSALARRGMADIEIWNTEFGWYIQNARAPNPARYKKLTPEQARNYLIRSFLLQAEQGIARAYHYAWNNKMMGIIEPDSGEVKVTVDGYRAAARWLVGATTIKCTNIGLLFTCKIIKGKDENLVTWSIAGEQRFITPKDYLYVQNSNLDVRTIDNLNTRITENPVCFSKSISGC